MSLIGDLRATRKPLAGFAAIGITWAAFFAQMPVIKAGVGASDGAYGVAVLWASLGAVAAMWLAPYAQRLVGAWAVPLAIVVIAIGLFGSGAVPSLWLLGLMLFLAASGSGITDVLINADVSQVEADTGRSLMNLNHALYSFSYAASALAVGVLREAGVAPMPIFAGVVCVLMFLSWASFGTADHPDAAAEAGTSQTPKLPPALIWLVGGVVFIAFLSEASAEGWSALHLERTLGGAPAEGALGPALLGLTMGIGRLSGHALARFMRDTTLMMLAMLTCAAGLAIAGLAETVVVALLGFAIAGLGISVVAPLALALIGRVMPRGMRMAAIARVSVIGYGAFFFGPPLMGLIAEVMSLRASFVTIAVVLAVVALTLIPALARKVAAER
ncbi:MFS transporter [Sulfitobacter sp. SK012]|nr:MFS transporter [Sulfitobacter sp. SK012]